MNFTCAWTMSGSPEQFLWEFAGLRPEALRLNLWVAECVKHFEALQGPRKP
jgi:hypothetical protein